ncbi:COG4223 family protein [Aminobacter sp. Piv2-1]|uniref:COG4223 family protein n=1 Tax=Aminobacter sp. Piv2-1 TaxID=3031122 RepID=UPI0030ACEAF9
MVKTPKTRHSKSHREPMTIELEPGAVSRVEEAATTEATEAAEPAEAIALTPGDEAVAMAEEAKQADAGETAAKPGDDYVSYDYSFDNEQPKAAETPKPAASESVDAGPAPSATVQRGGMPTIAAGIAGGLIALLAAGGLQFAGILGAPGGSGAPAGADQMQAEIESLKSRVADLGASNATGDVDGRVAGLASAIDQVKAEIETLKTGTGQAGSSEALAGLDDRIKAVEGQVASLGQGGGVSADIAALNERVAALDATVKAVGEATKSDAGDIAALEQSMSSLASKVEAQASQPKIALAIAASALKAAVDRGGGFAAELETFAAIAPDSPQLAALRGYAEKGVATRADIVAETGTVADAMIAAAKPVNPDAGIVERLVSSAEQLVKVRPIGQVEGSGVPETVARMEVAVNQGDFAKAIAEYETLPEAAKAAGADFAAMLKARLDVENQVDQLVANAMKA